MKFLADIIYKVFAIIIEQQIKGKLHSFYLKKNYSNVRALIDPEIRKSFFVILLL